MFRIQPRVIAGNSSIFLDVLRILASLTVFYIHAFNSWFPLDAHKEGTPGEPSHSAVIVFFVLSGFVIGHTTISRNRGFAQFAQARLSRLCAIVIPALAITAVIQLIAIQADPAFVATFARSHSFYRYLLSGLFLNEIWFSSAAPPINIVLWSLSFEFWYYAIFGLWVFRKGGWKSFILPVLALFIAGPKILMMMPIWLCGYLAYILPRPKLSTRTAWILVFTGFVVTYIALRTIPFYPYLVGFEPFYYANQFATDWVIGVILSATLWILPTGTEQVAESEIAPWLRKLADLTFPLYVLHYPLLILWRALFGYKDYNYTQLWQVISSVFVVAIILGVLLEMQRPLWGRFFKWLIPASQRKLRQYQGTPHSK